MTMQAGSQPNCRCGAHARATDRKRVALLDLARHRPASSFLSARKSDGRGVFEAGAAAAVAAKVLSVAFAIDGHDREVFAWTASPRPLTGADNRTLMEKLLWARIDETADGAVRASGSPITAPVRGDGLGGIPARARLGPYYDTGVEPGEQRARGRLRATRF